MDGRFFHIRPIHLIKQENLNNEKVDWIRFFLLAGNIYFS